MASRVGNLLRRIRSLWTAPRGSDAAPAGGLDPMLRFVASDPPELVRLDPPGLVAGASVLGATQRFAAHHHANLLVFARGGERSAVVPPALGDPSARPRKIVLDRVAGTAWTPGEGALTTEHFLALQRAQADASAARVDLAPLLQGGLRRLADERDPSALLDALGFLDVLAGLRGHGKELERPWVETGEAAVERLSGELAARRPDRLRREGSRVWIDPTLREGLPEPLRQELLAPAGEVSTGAWQAVALVDRTLPIAHAVGGYDAESVLVTLRVRKSGWSYERRVLWSEHDPGAEAV